MKSIAGRFKQISIKLVLLKLCRTLSVGEFIEFPTTEITDEMHQLQ
jgi:hypothetical protein